MGKATDRQRTVHWKDPRTAASQAQKMTGLEFLQKIIEGDVAPPPIGKLTGMELVEVGEGRAVFQLLPQEFHYNPIGSVHGGVIATICDSAASCAVQSLLPAGKFYTTLEMKVNYLRPITDQVGLLRCTGLSIHAGRRTAMAEARLEDNHGKLYAYATVTCIIFQEGG
jgi:uncharacterized protein (TIGR00369 family)